MNAKKKMAKVSQILRKTCINHAKSILLAVQRRTWKDMKGTVYTCTLDQCSWTARNISFLGYRPETKKNHVKHRIEWGSYYVWLEIMWPWFSMLRNWSTKPFLKHSYFLFAKLSLWYGFAFLLRGKYLKIVLTRIQQRSKAGMANFELKVISFLRR